MIVHANVTVISEPIGGKVGSVDEISQRSADVRGVTLAGPREA